MSNVWHGGKLWFVLNLIHAKGNQSKLGLPVFHFCPSASVWENILACMSSSFPIAILNGTCFFYQTRWSFISKRVACQKLTIIRIVSLLSTRLAQLTIFNFLPFYFQLPLSRRHNNVKSDYAYTIIKCASLSPYTLILSSCTTFTVYPNPIM